MSNLVKFSLVAVLSAHITGCSALDQVNDVEYITPLQSVSLNIGESAIVHGAVDQCGQDSLRWSDITLQLPISETGFFSNAGHGFIKSKRCGATTPALKVRFTANKPGSEDLIVLGDPMKIVVSDHTPSLQSGSITPKKADHSTPSVPVNRNISSPQPGTSNPAKTETSEESMMDTIFKWIDRDATTP